MGTSIGSLGFCGRDAGAYFVWRCGAGVFFLPGEKKEEIRGVSRLGYSLTKPHNASYVALGTVFLWFGWFGFNGGSALGSNLRAVMACIVTNLSASVGGLAWLIVDYIQLPEKKWGTIGWCSGAVARSE